MRTSTVVLPALVIAAACTDAWPSPAPIDEATLVAEHDDWREYRRGRKVTPPGGEVLWIGLWDIPLGGVTLGSAPSNPIRLPEEDAPPVAGRLERDGQEVRLVPAAGASFFVREGDPEEDPAAVVLTPVTGPIVVENDRAQSPTTLVLGSLGIRVHSERGTDRLWLRAWDEDSPLRETFRLPPFYDVTNEWRVAARFEPYDEPELLRVPDVRGGTIEYRIPGELRFRLGGREHTLQATAGESSSRFFVMMWDSTATVDTYQAGRYLQVEFPDDEGWTEIDFNRAYNPPCVFTPHSVCALPPRANWLQAHVTAGEKRVDPPLF